MSKIFMPRPIQDLVILGLGQSSSAWPGMMARDSGLRAEVWTINAGMRAFRHDVAWDMHTEEYIYGQKHDEVVQMILARRKEMETHDKPIVMPQALPLYPTSQTYPLKLVIQLTGSDYFQTGMAYMLAMAVLCGVKRLFLIGSDWIAKTKTIDEVYKMENGRACVEYWLGRLSHAGCQVVVPDRSPVLGGDVRANGMIYGYDMPMEEIPDWAGVGLEEIHAD